MSGFDTFFILNAFHCAFLAFSFQVSKTQLFLLRLFVGFVDFKFKFLLRILKLNVFESSQTLLAKTDEILARCRNFCLTKSFVRRIILSKMFS